jgi:hypothetical protein
MSHSPIRDPISAGGRRNLTASGRTLMAEGLWISGAQFDHSGDDLAQITHDECRHYSDDTRCRDVENVLTSFYEDGAGHAAAIIIEADITRWSQSGVEAELRPRLSDLTVRYWFELEKQTATKAWIRPRGTEYCDLQDGFNIYEQLMQKRNQAPRRIVLLPEYEFRPFPSKTQLLELRATKGPRSSSGGLFSSWRCSPRRYSAWYLLQSSTARPFKKETAGARQAPDQF